MKKLYLMIMAVGTSAAAFAGYGSGCFNSCNYPACNPGGPGCGVQGVPTDVREYRANPNQGYYSTSDQLPGYAPSTGQNLKQGNWGPSQYRGNQRGYGYNNQAGSQMASDDQKIYNDVQSQLKGYNLNIIVRQGVVTLQGRVNSESDKKAINDKVHAMPSVKRLNNQIQVVGGGANAQQPQTPSGQGYMQNRGH